MESVAEWCCCGHWSLCGSQMSSFPFPFPVKASAVLFRYMTNIFSDGLSSPCDGLQPTGLHQSLWFRCQASSMILVSHTQTHCMARSERKVTSTRLRVLAFDWILPGSIFYVLSSSTSQLVWGRNVNIYIDIIMMHFQLSVSKCINEHPQSVFSNHSSCYIFWRWTLLYLPLGRNTRSFIFSSINNVCYFFSETPVTLRQHDVCLLFFVWNELKW